ncbi:MAG TPA: protein kinase [Candidatus Wallbacteria bacterium]|nr:protein kinase [Candidatus Wallbacteria bacterium]
MENVKKIEDGLAAGDRSRFKISYFLGEGSFGKVYRCQDTKHNRMVALKILKEDSKSQKIVRDLFKRECEFSSNIGEEHLITTLEYFISDDFVYSIMELIDGIDLNVYLEELNSISLASFKTIAEQIASGLHFFHYHGLLHCDLKPANIMINPDNLKLKIIDLGLSHFKFEENILEKNMVAGTKGYMSPEQAAGSKTINPASDIYSVGAICYELLTGSTPRFDGTGKLMPPSSCYGVDMGDDESADKPDEKIIEEKTVKAITALDQMISTCLQANPKNRFKNAMEFRDFLQKIESPPRIGITFIRNHNENGEARPTEHTMAYDASAKNSTSLSTQLLSGNDEEVSKTQILGPEKPAFNVSQQSGKKPAQKVSREAGDDGELNPVAESRQPVKKAAAEQNARMEKHTPPRPAVKDVKHAAKPSPTPVAESYSEESDNVKKLVIILLVLLAMGALLYFI